MAPSQTKSPITDKFSLNHSIELTTRIAFENIVWMFTVGMRCILIGVAKLN